MIAKALPRVPESQWSIEEADLVRSICEDSFFEFVKEFWGVVVQEEPVWNWHIEYLCDELQYVAELVFAGEDKEHDLIINVPPGMTKSVVCSIMFPAWVWTRMPSARSICGSHTHELVLDLSRKTRDVVQSDKFQACWPDITLKDDQNTKGYFANESGGVRLCCTIGGKTPTGFHAHFLIVDDPIDPQKALSEAELKAANTWMNQTLPTRKVNKTVSVTILIMQRLHQDDPSGNALAQKNADKTQKRICLPAETSYDVHPPKLKRFYVDGLLDPVRLPRSVLVDMLSRLGEYGYAGQFGQNPVPKSGGMFKVERMRIDVPPALKDFKALCRYWDNAITEDGGAFTVGALIGRDHLGRYWVLDVVRGQWESSRREDTKVVTAAMDGKLVMIGQEEEGGSSGKESSLNTVRRLAGFRVKIHKPTGDKVVRADTFSDQVNAGNFWMKEGEWNREYIEELRLFPKSKYKDQVDASSGAFTLLTKPQFKLGAIGNG